MKIKSIKQTCPACPSQWEGHLEDGRMFYIRYRWGHLSISVSDKPTDDVYDAVKGKEVLSKDVGDELDGTMSWDELHHAAREFFTEEPYIGTAKRDIAKGETITIGIYPELICEAIDFAPICLQNSSKSVGSNKEMGDERN